MLEIDDYSRQKINDPDGNVSYEEKAQLKDGYNVMKISHIVRKGELFDKKTEYTYSGQFLALQAVQSDGTCMPTFVQLPLTGVSKTGKTYLRTATLSNIAKIIGCKGEAFAGIPEKGERLPSVLDKPFGLGLKANHADNGKTYYNIDWDLKENLFIDPAGITIETPTGVPLDTSAPGTEEGEVPW